MATRPTTDLLAKIVPVRRDRRFKPDLAGYWEAVGDGQNPHPAVMMQISQAGAGLAVWFCRPPTGLAGVGRWVLKDSSGRERPGWAHGVASGYIVDRDGKNLLTSGAGIPVNWMAIEASAPGLPDRLFNPLDPSMLAHPPVGPSSFEGNGLLSLPGSGAETLRVSFDGDGRSWLTLRRVRGGVRYPRKVIDKLPEPLRTRALVEQVRPIPTTLERQLLSHFDIAYTNGAEPDLAGLLRAWKGQSGQQRKQRGREIAKLLDFGIDEPWRTKLVDLMALTGGVHPLVLDGEQKTYFGWLREVLQSDMPDAATPGNKALQEAIRQLGIGSAQFAYQLSFDDAGPQQRVIGINLGVSAVAVVIKKYKVTLKKDNRGRVVYDPATGLAVVDKRTEIPWQSLPPLVGGFGRLDAGLTFDLMSDKVKVQDADSKLEVGAADLGKIEFVSALDLASPDDFAGATFTVASFVVGQGKVGNWVKVQAVDSALWELHLRGHERLVTVVSNDHYQGPTIANWGSLVNPQWWKDWSPSKHDDLPWAQGTAFRVGMGAGYLVGRPGAFTAKAPDVEKAPEVREVPTALIAGTPALFEYDSADLDHAAAGAVTTPRMRFELALAEIRGVFASGGGRPLLFAMTSPEGEPPHNLTLSENRGAAVKQAIDDALGAVAVRETPRVVPLGERAARAPAPWVEDGVTVVGGGLKDPEDYPSRDAFFASTDGPSAKKWPAWRRVDVVVEGLLVVSFVSSGFGDGREKP